MAAVMNGIALHGGFIPYGGTFLTFSDYSRNAIRMAALMKQRVIHVFTHDSIGLGEDGPTHQSIEHAASLRLIPEPRRLAPGDTAETAVAWARGDRAAASGRRALLLSRQNLPYRAEGARLDDIAQGRLRAGRAGRGRPEQQAAGGDHRHRLARCSSRCTRSSSSPSRARHRGARRLDAVHDACSTARAAAYKRSVLPPGVPRIAVEVGVTDGWWKYGCAAVVGIDRYGESRAGAGAVQALRVHGRERRRDGASSAGCSIVISSRS